MEKAVNSHPIAYLFIVLHLNAIPLQRNSNQVFANQYYLVAIPDLPFKKQRAVCCFGNSIPGQSKF